jgi:hypothetical protein
MPASSKSASAACAAASSRLQPRHHLHDTSPRLHRIGAQPGGCGPGRGGRPPGGPGTKSTKMWVGCGWARTLTRCLLEINREVDGRKLLRPIAAASEPTAASQQWSAAPTPLIPPPLRPPLTTAINTSVDTCAGVAPRPLLRRTPKWATNAAGASTPATEAAARRRPVTLSRPSAPDARAGWGVGAGECAAAAQRPLWPCRTAADVIDDRIQPSPTARPTNSRITAVLDGIALSAAVDIFTGAFRLQLFETSFLASSWAPKMHSQRIMILDI